MPPIAQQLPVVFANGSRWDELDGECGGCGQPIPPQLLRGRVSRPIESVVVIEAAGVCRECALLSRFHFRLHNATCGSPP